MAGETQGLQDILSERISLKEKFRGKDTSLPKATEEERQMQREQTSLIAAQRENIESNLAQQELLKPMFYEAAGITPEYDSEGNIIGFSRAGDETGALRSQIEKGFLQRTLAGLKGELPEDPALLRDLRQQEETLRERLRKQLGPGAETSSAGIEALARQNEARNIALYNARKGDISTFANLGIRQGQDIQDRINEFLKRGLGIAQIGSTDAFGQLAARFDPALARGLEEREAIQRGRIKATELKQEEKKEVGGIIGSFFGKGGG